MANQVIKKDGKKEPFKAEKIRASIVSAAEEGTDLSEEETERLSEELGAKTVVMALEKDTIPTSEIRQFVLSELDKTHPSVSEAWRKYDKTKKE